MLLPLLCLPLVLLALGACGRGGGDAAPANGTAAAGAGAAAAPGEGRGDAAAVDVLSTAVISRPMGTEIEALGTAMARESVEVTAKVTNTVKAIRFEEGTRVRRGAVLVELDDSEARADVAEAEAALADSESQFRRSRELLAQQALAQSALDTIESNLKANRARLAAARARLEDTVIRAGFDGQTGFRRVSVGALVTPGTVITTLDDTTLIKLSFTVPETRMSVLQKGLEVTAVAAGLPGRSFTGRISQLASRVDPVSRSITVHAEIPNGDGTLRPGMSMSVTLSGRVAPALVIPEAALVPERGDSYVYVVRDGRAERRQVQTGRRRPGEVEIVSGLMEGERVIVEGTQNLASGAAVREREYVATTAAAGS